MEIAIIEQLHYGDQVKFYVKRSYEVFKERLPNLAVEHFMGNKRDKKFYEKYSDEEIKKLIRDAVLYSLRMYETEIKQDTIKVV